MRCFILDDLIYLIVDIGMVLCGISLIIIVVLSTVLLVKNFIDLFR